MKIRTLLCSVACLALAGCSLNNNNRGFAIVVDPVTYEKTKADIERYAQAIEEKENLQPVIVVDRWGVPDSIRHELIRLYHQKNHAIEGAVFIGDIPVPMVRDAQHLTSAFKMDQEVYDWHTSSVPTDRFYDDFDLKFRFIRRDSTETSYFYYSLLPESAQYLEPELYTGRIKANDNGGTSRYEKISAFLQKAVAQKYEDNVADQVLFFSGHGYVSESAAARLDEKVALLENFPLLKHQHNGIEYIDHKRDKAIKYRLKSEMQREDLDVAILHHHGDPEIQYMNGIPYPKSTDEEVANVKLYLRESMRHAREKGKDLNVVKARLAKMYDGIPDSWYNGSFDRATTVKDSLFIRSLDLYIDEFDTYHPNARMVILDACFNGSFHKQQYIAGAYLFNTGKTVAVIANSVNVLQDKWHDRYIGLMPLGMRIGRLVQYNPYLESHLIGDPTFHFTTNDRSIDVNRMLSAGDADVWAQQLGSPYPAVRAMALRQMVLSGKDCSSLLLETFKSSDSYIVRIEAMVLLSLYNDSNFIECLQLAVDDSFELVQRFAINFIAKSGDSRLVPSIIKVAIRNNTSERCEFNTKMAMSLFSKDQLVPEFEKQFETISYYADKKEVHDAIRHSVEFNSTKWLDEKNMICNDSLDFAKKKMYIRLIRNINLHNNVPELLEYVVTTKDVQTQKSLWEALGWFNLSSQRKQIAEKALKVSADSAYTDVVRAEALKTYNRIMK